MIYGKCIIVGAGHPVYQCASLLKSMGRLDGIYEYAAFQQSGLEELCKQSGYPYMCLNTKEDADRLMEALCKDNCRVLILSISNIYIFPDFICKNENIEIINCHPALISAHLGRNAEAWSIYEQDKVAGVVWHKVTPDIDMGKIYIQKEIPLNTKCNSLKLKILQNRVALELLKEILPLILMGKEIKGIEVEHVGVMHYSSEIPNNGLLDINWNGEKISAFLRCMDYGKLNTLGKAALYENGKKYTWDDYRIVDNPEAVADNPNDRIIAKDNMVFILKNYHQCE